MTTQKSKRRNGKSEAKAAQDAKARWVPRDVLELAKQLTLLAKNLIGPDDYLAPNEVHAARDLCSCAREYIQLLEMLIGTDKTALSKQWDALMNRSQLILKSKILFKGKPKARRKKKAA